MKHLGKLWTACLLIFALAGTATAVPMQGKMLRESRIGDHPKGMTRWIAGMGHGNPTIAADSSHSWDATNLDIVLEPNISTRTLDATVTLSGTSEEDNLETVDFNLNGGTINTLQIQDQDVDFTRDGDVVNVTLPTPLNTGDEFAITVAYTINFQSNSNFDGGIYYSSNSDVVYTFGEPYGTRNWLACYDLPFDKVTMTLNTILPNDYYVLANGVQTDLQDLGDGRTSTTWTSTDPISTYLISMAASPYTIVTADPAGQNDTEIHYWVYPEQEVGATYDFGRTGEMIDYFEGLFGPYPFNKYDQAMAPILGGWGAMEHQTCTTFGASLAGDGTRTYEGVVAHELGHQWFGDWVGPLDFANIWLNEGFASYADALWSEHQSQAQMNNTMASFRNSYFYEDQHDDRFPIYDPPYDPSHGIDYLFSSTVYDKGAWILHMLRWVVGDDAFFSGLQLYGQNHAYGSATTQEFQADMETASGMDLSPFFTEWVYGQGYPEYRFSDFHTQDGSTALLRIEQLQSNAPLFTTPLPFRLQSADQDTVVRIEVAASEDQVVTIPGLSFTPTSYTFDPDHRILCIYQSLGVPEWADGLPSSYEIENAWPNPFNASTRLTLAVPSQTHVTVDVFDLLGRRVARLLDGPLSTGEHALSWQPAPDVASGTYLIHARFGQVDRMKRITLVK